MTIKATGNKIYVADIGQTDYQPAWQYQLRLQQELIDRKKVVSAAAGDEHPANSGYLLFTEHPHVYTLGKSGSKCHLLLNEEGLRRNRASFVQTDRGGDITYHGPGQLVGYSILDLDVFGTDIAEYLAKLEDVVILTLADYGIKAGRSPGFTGVWTSNAKICAMGVKCSRWVTMHGFALNVNTNLDYFGHIVPCGIADREVTSMKQLIGKNVEPLEVKQKVRHYFASVFDCELISTPLGVM